MSTTTTTATTNHRQPPHQIQLRAPSPPPPTNKLPSSTPPTTTTLFDRLPTELRLQIYDLLFPDKPIPAANAVNTGDSSVLRRDGTSSSGTTALLRLSRAIHDEASAVLYARCPFEVRLHPGGVALARGRQLTHADFDFGKRGGPCKVYANYFDGIGGCDGGVLARARRLDVKVVAWVQHGVFEHVCAYVRHFVERVVRAQAQQFQLGAGAGDDGNDNVATLLDLRLSVEWHNGTTNFPVTHPTPQMARQLLEPFIKHVRVWRSLDVGNVGTPRYFFGAPALAAAEESEYRALKEELRDSMLLR
ncbi:uncharacterized protein BKCO1_20000122 [Diplodia corticola]|uniref:Uncharacterized protein n=1 Tax=Diplodia corticola TaxID=236234 RepID=A0A1J9S2J4_9PEZI|nr:uncharacterized protein BKCO1_20000122 [Diplodia corticola]OJD34791.1 hypothetical protein BKCO1_20000122 [Diplodia corticola]